MGDVHDASKICMKWLIVSKGNRTLTATVHFFSVKTYIAKRNASGDRHISDWMDAFRKTGWLVG
jgi:hypothetical protein